MPVTTNSPPITRSTVCMCRRALDMKLMNGLTANADARERDADEAVRLGRAVGFRPFERRSVPGIRHTNAQVHIVGNMRMMVEV